MITGNRVSRSGIPYMFAHQVIHKFVKPRPQEQVMILTDSETESDFVDAFAAAVDKRC